MTEPIIDFYILFHNHTDGMALHKFLRDHKIDVRICPAPRSVSVCCGMALLVQKEDIDTVKELLPESNIPIVDIAPLERNFDPHRDHYC